MNTIVTIALSSSPDTTEDAHSQGISGTSATSFLTAPQPALTASSRSSSVHTLSRSAVSKSQSVESHREYGVDGAVVAGNGSILECAIHRVGSPVQSSTTETRPASTDSKIGPPPPSPPASFHDQQDADTEDSQLPTPDSPVSPTSPSSRPVTFEDPVRRPSSSSSRKLSPRIPPSIGRRSSADTEGSHRTLPAAPRITRTSTNLSDGAVEVSLEDDIENGHPQTQLQKPSRRYTMGSASPLPSSSSRLTRSMTMQATQYSFEMDELDEELGELASDIQQQAERIRKERMSKRAKAALEAEKIRGQDAEKALTRTTSRGFNDKPLVGNVIGEGHANYVLMFNMLTGIRVAVSRCQAKIRRPLTDADFTAAHKYSFDIVGNELTPSTKYDFKFKDYAPWVFRELREDYFHLDPADYLLSLTAKYILSELGSPGKSGSFFYFSRDYRFIIKTIHHTEHKFLRRILRQYHEHVKSNPHTLLSRFYGLHRVKLPHGRKIHFVIMNNLFPPHKDIHETYDLKGSTIGREYPEEKAAQNPRAVLKDLNWINRGKSLELGPEKRALLTEQIRRDSELLKRLDVMDYSLLVGIHNMIRGNRDNVRRNTLKVFSPEVRLIRRKPTTRKGKGPLSPEAIAMRRVVRQSDPKRLDSNDILPDEDTGERQYFLFYQDEGGLRATDEANESLDTIYYLGIIDILTPYTTFKKLEHFWKGLSADRHKISPVPPGEYADRFFGFMKAIMRGGEGGGRFKAE